MPCKPSDAEMYVWKRLIGFIASKQNKLPTVERVQVQLGPVVRCYRNLRHGLKVSYDLRISSISLVLQLSLRSQLHFPSRRLHAMSQALILDDDSW